jgi:hypothetical protein
MNRRGFMAALTVAAAWLEYGKPAKVAESVAVGVDLAPVGDFTAVTFSSDHYSRAYAFACQEDFLKVQRLLLSDYKVTDRMMRDSVLPTNFYLE